MPRPPRLLLPKSFYHVMTRGNNKKQVFRSDADYQYYLARLSLYKNQHPFDLYHYCLMPNHTHFLIQTKNAFDFAQFMKKLNLSYFHYYRGKYGWVGHFWQDRYRSQPVGKDAYLIQCGKYIELNPVRQGLVKAPEEYRYSSHGYYQAGEPNNLITADIFYKSLGRSALERQKEYTKLIMGESLLASYKQVVWAGSSQQRNNEKGKLRYHLKTR